MNFSKFLTVFMISASIIIAAELREKRNLTLSAENLSELEVKCGAGFLKISGQEGLSEIRVSAQIEAYDGNSDNLREAIEKGLELSLEKREDRAYLISDLQENNSHWWRGLNIQVNLEVEVPPNMKLDIDDGSGFIEVRNVNSSIEIEDGSGDITIDKNFGGLSIEDGSGSIEIENVTGDVEIDDGSGQITLKDIKGNVIIDDGSGSIHASEITGNIEVYDGSGEINIDKVGKDVIIRESGSGDVHISGVQGQVLRYDKD